MIQIPPQIQVPYDALLVEKAIPKGSHYHYRKWLRYYLDFCLKYNFKQSHRESLAPFLNKLKEKRQTDQQQKQASHAISIYYEIEPVQRNVAFPFKNKAEKLSTQKEISKLTGADWRPLFAGLDSEIKLRHYSPKTLSAYRGWVKQFQGFTRSKDPKSLVNSDVKEFLTFLAVKRKVSASNQNQAFNALLFLFKHILKKEFGDSGIIGAQRCPNHHDLYAYDQKPDHQGDKKSTRFMILNPSTGIM